MTNIGTLTTTDQDTGDSFTYSLEAGATTAFTISGDMLQSNQAFDFEMQDMYTVTVRTTDSDDLWYSETITVTILDDGGVPTDVVLGGAHIITEELAIGTDIGQLSTLHEDSSQSFTYTLVDGATTALRCSSILQDTLFRSFEHESKKSVFMALHCFDVTFCRPGGE